MEWQWMRHPQTGGTQRFAAPSVPEWQEAGWDPRDPREAPKLAIGPGHPGLAASTEQPVSETKKSAGSGASPAGKRTTGRAPATDKEE